MSRELPNPKPKCELVGLDGNAFAIMGRVAQSLKKGGYSHLVKQYQDEAMSGDYNNLLRVSMEYVEDVGHDRYDADEEEFEDDDEEYEDEEVES